MKLQSISYLIVLLLLFFGCQNKKHAIALTTLNYGKEIDRLAKEFNMPAEYLKALIVLECSGRKDFTPRFEKRVYEELKQLKEGRISFYKEVTQVDVEDASDDALKNMATSWGPFQVMGYKCLHLGVKVQDLRGKDAVYWGVVWIDREYGVRLRNGDFEQAFRIHNTGSPTGHTHDPNYVKNGLKYMQAFRKSVAYR